MPNIVEKLLTIDEGGDKIIYTGYMMLAFIPRDWFDRNLAYEISDGYSVYGVFRAYHFDDDMDVIDLSKGKPSLFEAPSMFTTRPSDVSDVTIDLGFGERRYKVFKYYNGDIVNLHRHHISDVSDLEKASQITFEGKMEGVDYGTIANLYNKCKIITQASLRVPAFYEHTIISTTYRSVDDITQEARFGATHDSVVVGIDSRQKAPMNNSFSGMCHEDIVLMTTICHNKAAKGIVEEPNAIEKVARGL